MQNTLVIQARRAHNSQKYRVIITTISKNLQLPIEDGGMTT